MWPHAGVDVRPCKKLRYSQGVEKIALTWGRTRQGTLTELGRIVRPHPTFMGQSSEWGSATLGGTKWRRVPRCVAPPIIAPTRDVYTITKSTRHLRASVPVVCRHAAQSVTIDTPASSGGNSDSTAQACDACRGDPSRLAFTARHTLRTLRVSALCRPLPSARQCRVQLLVRAPARLQHGDVPEAMGGQARTAVGAHRPAGTARGLVNRAPCSTRGGNLA